MKVLIDRDLQRQPGVIKEGWLKGGVSTGVHSVLTLQREVLLFYIEYFALFQIGVRHVSFFSGTEIEI